jgi:acyl carrier protein
MVRSALYETLQKNPKVKFNFLAQNSSFKEIGLDSLDIVELLADLEDRFKVDLRDDEVVNTETIEEALKVFVNHLDISQVNQKIITHTDIKIVK